MLPLVTSASDERELSKRLEAARQLYNAALGESFRRLALMRQSKNWQLARAMKKGDVRSVVFKQVALQFNFNEYSLHSYIAKCRNGSDALKQHIDSQTAKHIAKRAFDTVQKYCFGKIGRPKFKRFRALESVESVNNTQGIVWKNGKVTWNTTTGKTHILSLAVRLEKREKAEYQNTALECRTKFCRIIRKTLKGRDRWYVQLIQEGVPPTAGRKIGSEVVGLDIGPSTVAIVSESSAILRDLCPRVEPFQKEKRRLQRAMDRSKRATNPDNYEANGKAKNGAHKWIKSRRYINQKFKVAEQERRLAAERKRSHGELTNQILALGNQIKTEKLSYKSFQKNFGRSVKKQAPGMFVEMLRRKADAAGGCVDEFSTYSTKLSQTCHGCGSVKKKRLSLRIHECDCGIGPVQRDLYSAFLARHVRADKLDANQATLA